MGVWGVAMCKTTAALAITPRNHNGFYVCGLVFRRPRSDRVLDPSAFSENPIFAPFWIREFTFERSLAGERAGRNSRLRKSIGGLRKLEHVLPELVNMYSGGGKFRIHLLHLKTRRLMKRGV